MGEHRSNESTDPGECPEWCVRQHATTDHPEDLVHQSRPVNAALVTGRPWLDDVGPRAMEVVARLVQEPGTALTWLDVAGEDAPAFRMTISATSGRQLVDAL